MSALLGIGQGAQVTERPPQVVERRIQSNYPYPGNMAAAFPAAEGRGSELEWYLVQVGNEQSFRKPPQREGALIDLPFIRAKITQNHAAVSRDIDDLRAIYVFADDSINGFLQEHHAHRTLLRQAIDPLKLSFGADKVFRLEIKFDEDDSRTLYGVALWRDSVRTAAQAHKTFVEDWWLDHMSAETSDLAFVYRIAR